jgi:plasmid segregation protein ParM
MDSYSVYGIDVGHSGVKISLRHDKSIFFPSIAIPAVQIADSTERRRAELETVTVNGSQWFFGQTALFQSGGKWASGLTDNWIDQDSHTALLAGALKKVLQADCPTPSLVALGLPVKLMKTYRKKLEAVAKSVFGERTDVLIVPQPVGAYSTITLNINGHPNDQCQMQEVSWAVIDVGYYTTDIILMMEGRWVQVASDSLCGMSHAAEHLQRLLAEKDIRIDLDMAEQGIRTGKVRHFGLVEVPKEAREAVAHTASTIIDGATRLLDQYVSRLDGVLVAGGGAEPIVEHGLGSLWPNVKLATNPRFAVAEGLRRLGEAYQLSRLMRAA